MSTKTKKQTKPRKTDGFRHRVERKVIRLEPSDTWKCECGNEHALGGYVAAHWTEKLIHTCDCGRKHSIRRGLLELVSV